MKMTLNQRAPQIKMAGGRETARRGKLYDKLKKELSSKKKKKAGVPVQKKRKLKSKKPLIRIQGRQ